MKKLNLTTGTVALVISLVAGAVFTPNTSFAFDEQSAAPINVDKQGVGIKGYDPVAYFTVGAPTPGLEEFSASHSGVTYRFADAANLSAFKADPDKYAPQYGGFCAYGVAVNKKFDGDPKQWHVADGKLYLNFNGDVQKKWLKDINEHNKQADTNWPNIAKKAPSAL